VKKNMSKISEIEKYFEASLPKAYREFISSLDQEIDGDVYLYLLDDLIERNECYETKEYVPGYINIGNNGGGMAFIIKLSEEDSEVLAVDHGSMDPEIKELVSVSFNNWLASGFKYDAG
jgi:hypothetical protein